ncbi:response regulator transcription factor [Paenibacillus glycinis]|uniref:Response regulator n=1 Tax=Paenibacillus glycinis TaxID=2697035 RepID=A0ABW9XYF3_9BACL|nr:response regulator [Paenibacillus glycinis]NBD27757.1 response regulator [Paenibacillus glycinis]
MIRVLVVDDEKLVRQGLITSLPWAEYGMEVVGEAKNGEKAIEFLAEREVDLMLTDLAMPVMSGIELMRIVRKRYPRLYIIVLTLHQDFEYIQEALRLGAIDYIAKVELTADRFSEILARIRERIAEEEKKRQQSGGETSAEGNEDRTLPEAQAVLPDVNEDRLSDAAEHWLSPGWVQDDEGFGLLRDKLCAMNLSPDRLMRLLSRLTEEWNALYGSILAEKLELPAAFADWPAVSEWLNRTRTALSKALGSPHYSQEVQDAVKKAVQLIQEQLGGQLYAADIAKRVNMSRSYFSQCFRDIVGKTFNEYVRQARVDKAKEYLMHTNMPILWVAEKTGYLDGKYFSTVFRDQTGELPSAFRKIHRKE